MAYTKHGHHIPGTIKGKDPPEKVARCGGPSLCSQCSVEVLRTPQEPEHVYHDEGTMQRVKTALQMSGLDLLQIHSALRHLANNGIVFRELTSFRDEV